MTDLTSLEIQLNTRLGNYIQKSVIANNELTLEVAPTALYSLCLTLRDDSDFQFEQLIDICGIDYAHYGLSEWETSTATCSGFERGVTNEFLQEKTIPFPSRFAVIYHFLSLTHNHRIRLKVFVPDSMPMVDSIIDIWPAANWFEREAFDLYGILFNNHPDLRRILTDYGFIGHPFRKDFPLIGNVEVRYDAELGRVIYEPVTSIQPRTLVPKTIRDDNRYTNIKG
ncbi:MAG: NADH-quinone oxidoreductase chain 5 [Legionellaceae bacterium]